MHRSNLLRAARIVVIVATACAPLRAAAAVDDVVVEKMSAADLAKVHFERGQRMYNLGEFAAALDEYKTAYRLNPLPAFLFNIGQCHFALGDYDRAIFFYEGFLRESPSGEYRAQVEKLIAEAEAKQASSGGARTTSTGAASTGAVTDVAPAGTTSASAAPSTPLAAPADDAPPSLTEDEGAPWLWPVVIGGAAVVVVGVAAGVGAVAYVVSQTTLPTRTLDPIDATGAAGAVR